MGVNGVAGVTFSFLFHSQQIFLNQSSHFPEELGILYKNVFKMKRSAEALIQCLKNAISLFTDIIRQSPLMSDEFKARARLRYDKLLPVEIDTGLTIEEKIPTVIASFKEAFDDLVESRKINKTSLAQMITNAGDSCSFELRYSLLKIVYNYCDLYLIRIGLIWYRDFCHETLKLLHDAQVPTLIFSAGFGDVIQGILQKYALHYPNIHIIGNFMEFDEDGQLIGFKDPLIHTFNKNEDAVPQNCRYFDELSHRANVILLGDSIGDADMAQGVHGAGTVLKIGFLNEVVRTPSELCGVFS